MRKLAILSVMGLLVAGAILVTPATSEAQWFRPGVGYWGGYCAPSVSYYYGPAWGYGCAPSYSYGYNCYPRTSFYYASPVCPTYGYGYNFGYTSYFRPGFRCW